MRVMVVGATGGIGSTLCHQLMIDGANVFAIGRDDKKLNELINSVGDIESHLLHNISFEEIDKALKSAADSVGNLDGVVNCIGSILFKPAHLTRED